MKEGYTGDGTRLFTVVPIDAASANGQKQKHRRFHLSIGKHFCYEHNQVPAQVGQRGGEISNFGDNLKLSKHNPRQVALGDSA